MVISLVIFSFTSREEGKINIFPVDKDIELGQEVTRQILSDPTEYPVLDREKYTEAYEHIERIRDGILASGEVKYADQFDWGVYIYKVFYNVKRAAGKTDNPLTLTLTRYKSNVFFYSGNIFGCFF